MGILGVDGILGGVFHDHCDFLEGVDDMGASRKKSNELPSISVHQTN